MRRIFCTLFALLFALPCFHVSLAATETALSAKSAILLEAESGTVLFAKDAERRLPMASTTKIMTALLALEHCKPDEAVTVPKEAVGTEGSSLYLEAGEKFRAIDLVYGLMLRSANDAAVTLAMHISGSVEKFAELMNRKAQELSLGNTHFANPHGLDEEEHFTSARDLAMLAAAAMKNPQFAEIVSCRQKRLVPLKGTARLVTNHNKLLRRLDSCVGVKTGFTSESGRCLVGASEQNGLLFITVTLNAPNDWSDHIALFRRAKGALEKRVLYESGAFSLEIPVVGGEKNLVTLVNAGALCALLPPNAEGEIVPEYNVFACAPIRKGQVLGALTFRRENGESISVELVAEEDVPARTFRKSFFKKH